MSLHLANPFTWARPSGPTPWWILFVAWIAAWAGPAAAAAPTNSGGVLVANVEGELPYEYGTFDHCGELTLPDPGRAVARMAGDGLPRLVGVYAAFPPDSVGSLRAISFGIRYSENVRVVGQGACNGGGMYIAMNGWPATNGGMSVHVMPEGIQKGRMVPVYWLAISCKGKGSFELIPHPVPKLAGRFVGVEVPYSQEPIAGYGRIGFDSEGFVPVPGSPAQLAPCCVDDCYLLTKPECELYGGDFLGYGTSCDNLPCRDDAYLGGCCLPEGCQMLSIRDCARRGGTSLGEGVKCGDVPCPAAAPGKASPESGK